MSRLGEKLKHELRELIPVTLFFFGTFQLLALTQALMLKQFGIHVSSFLVATVMALVVAKVVLITDHFSLVNRFSDKSLSYSMAWKTPSTSSLRSWCVMSTSSSTSGDKQETLRRRTAGSSKKSSGRISGACNSGCSSCCWFVARCANWFGPWAARKSPMFFHEGSRPGRGT